MSQRYSLRLIPILLVVAAAIWVNLPNNPGIRIGSFQREIRVVRGLDLQGGLRVLLEADLPPDVEVTSAQMQLVRNIIENRVNALGVTEPVVQLAGSRRILVELPGIDNPEQAVATLRETGLLEFIEVPAADVIGLLSGAILPQTDFATASSAPTPTPEATPTTEPGPEVRTYRTVMTGAMLRTAAVTQDPETGELLVNFVLTDEGARIFGDYTSANVGGYLGILLDKSVISIPVIDEPITTGRGTISGDFTLESANQLAVQLKYGALPVPLVEAESKLVGPTLGQDSLRMSQTAGIIGLSVVLLFMALYYRLPGVLADLALLVYALLTFALFKLIPVTLTLPGIAGFILSLGMAVDANILIFQRMKEEVRAGRTLRQAVDLGFRRAWPSIRDSNISTLITCAILYWFGSTFGASIVKGFSLTLALGVIVSLFTAITVTRTFLHVVLGNLRLIDRPGWFGV